MPIQLMQGDITELELEVDVIVNAANSSLLGGGGVDGAIHRKAGAQLREECMLLGGCDVGDAKITKGYNLKAKHIIHTVGPIWRYGINNEEYKLTQCYFNSLQLLLDNHLKSIAFPCISTGAYQYPQHLAANIAIHTVQKFLTQHTDKHIDIIFCCYLKDDFDLYQKILQPSSFWIKAKEQIKKLIK